RPRRGPDHRRRRAHRPSHVTRPPGDSPRRAADGVAHGIGAVSEAWRFQCEYGGMSSRSRLPARERIQGKARRASFPPNRSGVRSKESAMRSLDLSRRQLFAYTAAVAAAGMTASAGVATARPGYGTLLDYAGGVPSAAQIEAAGHVGVIRYVSDRRPGAEWMAGKPLLAAEVEDLRAHGLSVVSCYQYGKAATADWRGGLEAGKRHAERGLELHLA